MKLKGEKDSRNWRKTSIEVNKRYLAEWVKIEDVDPDDDTDEGLEKEQPHFQDQKG